MNLEDKINDAIFETAKGWLDNSPEIVATIVAAVRGHYAGICPFCKVGDYDLIGLKHHLDGGFCDEYEFTEIID